MARLAFDLSVLRVLLVEDNTFARELEKTALQHLGVSRLTVAEDGADALNVLQHGVACDLIVSDWNMSGVGGLELLAAVRKNWPGISFLVLTGNESLDHVKAAIKAGADGCLIKPFSLDKLREAVQLALISKLTAGKPVQAKGAAASPELDKVTASIRKALVRPKTKLKINGGPYTLEDAHKLAEKLSNQLTGFMGSLDATGPEQLEVIRLHVDCMRAVLSGREDLLALETRNLIVDGLSFAAELVSE